MHRAPQTGPSIRAAFAALHTGPDPLLLPNGWDVASVTALARDGHPAVGTTSLGVAAAAGLPDATGATRKATLALVAALRCLLRPQHTAGATSRPGLLLTVDIEAGYGDTPEAVADTVEQLADAGVAGVNIEDGRGDHLDPTAQHAARITAIRDRTPLVFVNARTDTHWLDGPHTPDRHEQALRRAQTYLDAGADGVFVPGLEDDATIERLTTTLAAPLNLLAGTRPVADHARLAVRRLSTGSLLYRTALSAALHQATPCATAHPLDL